MLRIVVVYVGSVTEERQAVLQLRLGWAVQSSRIASRSGTRRLVYVIVETACVIRCPIGSCIRQGRLPSLNAEVTPFRFLDMAFMGGPHGLSYHPVIHLAHGLRRFSTVLQANRVTR
jgi:hypothetical protein